MNKRKSFYKISKRKLQKKKETNNGITLIALVISIIVMLILAGVSLNAVIGDNGIITQAQNATYAQSCAILEEWINQYYIEHYEELDQTQNKIVGIMNLGVDWIYQPSKNGYGNLNYIVDSDGKALYLIQKDNLPEEIKSQLQGGNLNGDTAEYSNFVKLEDVYGVTSNLKVYYCSEGKSSMLGISKEELDEDLPTRTVIDNINTGIGSILAQYDTDGDGKLSSQEVSGVKEITITKDSGLNNLSDIYNLYSLEKLILEEVNLESLNGLENCSKIYYIFIKNSTIGNYSAIGKLGSKLKYLYFLYATNDEVSKLGNDLANYDLPNLNYLGFFSTYNASVEYYFNEPTYRTIQSNTTELTDISGLAKLSAATKNAVKYLYINDNNITSLEPLAEFSNIYYLRAQNNQITSLKGLENKANLTYLQVGYNKLDDTTEIKDENADVLAAIAGNKNLYWLDLRNNKIKWISYLKDCTSLKYIYLDNIETIDAEDMAEIKDLINSAKNTVYSPKYSLSLVDNNISKLSINSQSITESQFKALKSCTNLTYLSLSSTNITNNDGNTLGESELNTLLNEVLSNFTKLTELSLYNIKFSNMSFISKMPNIKMLDLRNTLVTTEGTTGLTLLENCTKIGILAINNSSIDLSKIQNTINRLATNNVSAGSEGSTSHIFNSYASALICNNVNVLKTLEKCTNITNLEFGMQGYSYSNTSLNLDLTACTKLKSIYFYYITLGTVNLPSSVTYLHSTHSATNITFNSDSNLQKAYLRENSNVQNLLSNLSTNCKKLEDLEIFNNPNNVKDFGALKECTGLKTLRIGGANWTGKLTYTNINTLNNLKDLDSLETLSLYWLTIKDLDFISELTNLKNLNVYYTNLADISKISNLTNLTKLNMYNNSITNVESLGNLTNLTSLVLNNNYISSGINQLINLKSLTSLNLNNNSLSDTSTYIDSEGKQVRYNVLDVLVQLNKTASLKELRISGNNGILDTSILTQAGTNWNILEKE